VRPSERMPIQVPMPTVREEILAGRYEKSWIEIHSTKFNI
jgi:hypothetical protein